MYEKLKKGESLQNIYKGEMVLDPSYYWKEPESGYFRPHSWKEIQTWDGPYVRFTAICEKCQKETKKPVDHTHCEGVA